MKCYVNSMFLTVFVFVILITGTYAADPSLSFKAIENQNAEYPFDIAKEAIEAGHDFNTDAPTPVRYFASERPTLKAVANLKCEETLLISFEIDSETDDLISLDKDAEIGIITEIKGHYLVEFTYEKQRCRGYVKTERLSQQLAFMQIVVPLNIGDQIDNLGINQTGSNVNVYTGPSTSYSVKGYIVGNEIVYVYAEELGWYYIKYKTSTTDKAGYIFADNVSIPSTDYVRSIRDGVRTWDYNGSTHVGVDIDTGSLSNQTQNLYAIDQGDAKYYTRTKYISGLGWCTVSYVTMSS